MSKRTVKYNTIKTKFEEFCILKFGEENGEKVFKFYNKILKFKSESYSTANKKMNLTERKKTNIEFLVNARGEDIFIKCVDMFIEQHNSGILQTNDAKYFNNFTMKYSDYTFSKPQIFSQSEISKNVSPKRLLHNPEKYGYFPDNPDCEYDYLCECGETIDRWTIHCKKCGNFIDWGKLC